MDNNFWIFFVYVIIAEKPYEILATLSVLTSRNACFTSATKATGLNLNLNKTSKTKLRTRGPDNRGPFKYILPFVLAEPSNNVLVVVFTWSYLTSKSNDCPGDGKSTTSFDYFLQFILFLKCIYVIILYFGKMQILKKLFFVLHIRGF